MTFSAITQRRGNKTTTKELALMTNISMLAYQQFSSLIRGQYYVLITYCSYNNSKHNQRYTASTKPSLLFLSAITDYRR
jgi:hypothetical protein